MSSIDIEGLDGGSRSVDSAQIESLRGALRGPLLQPGDPAYDESRTIWTATAPSQAGRKSHAGAHPA